MKKPNSKNRKANHSTDRESADSRMEWKKHQAIGQEYINDQMVQLHMRHIAIELNMDALNVLNVLNRKDWLNKFCFEENIVEEYPASKVN